MEITTFLREFKRAEGDSRPRTVKVFSDDAFALLHLATAFVTGKAIQTRIWRELNPWLLEQIQSFSPHMTGEQRRILADLIAENVPDSQSEWMIELTFLRTAARSRRRAK